MLMFSVFFLKIIIRIVRDYNNNFKKRLTHMLAKEDEPGRQWLYISNEIFFFLLLSSQCTLEGNNNLNPQIA